jgi:molybdopterin molybdotransferase
MIPVEEAYKIIDMVIQLNPETEVDLKNCPGYFLSGDITAKDNIPCYDNSAMDGYAVRCRDLESASPDTPVELVVIGEIPAGKLPDIKVEPGQAARIMTGGAVPEGADAVVKVEDTEESGTRVEIFTSPVLNENIRSAGEDIKKGETVFRTGHCIKPADAGLLASLGVTRIPVYKKPEIALLVTGDEIISPEEKLVPGKVRNSNLYSLTGLLNQIGLKITELPQGRDSEKLLKQSLEKGMASDIIITSGAVSVGKYDLLRKVLSGMGMKEHFWRVKQKPGKPLLFGSLGGTQIFGLPGNPVSVTVTFLMYVRTAILKMMGAAEYYPRKVKAVLRQKYSKAAGLTHFIRGIYEMTDGRMEVTPYEEQGSGVLRSMSRSNCLVILEEEKEVFPEGSIVEIVIF